MSFYYNNSNTAGLNTVELLYASLLTTAASYNACIIITLYIDFPLLAIVFQFLFFLVQKYWFKVLLFLH